MSKKHSVLFGRGILILALVIALVAVVTGFAVPALSEDAYAPDPEDVIVTVPHIVHTHYTEEWLFALVDLPEDGAEYFMRITFFIPGNTFFILVLPIEADGTLFFYITCDTEYIAMQVVDRMDAIIPDSYTAYDALGFRGFAYE